MRPMPEPTFKDHFSRQAGDYSRFRPSYPPGLIAYVAGVAPSRALAIDCATGNGQAALALAEHFDEVLAIDGSAAQLAQAPRHPRVRYEQALAEALPAADASAAVVTAAQAVHWFDFERFHAECRRVLMPGGIVAVWTYTVFRAGAAIDAVVDRFYGDLLGPYWPPERAYVEQEYRTLPFPWEELTPPPFVLQTEWTLEQVLGYFASWSAVQRYRAAHGGADPLPGVARELATVWPTEGTVRLNWPLHLRLGRHRPPL
jgi:SAM-dependent methyltransferase